MKKTFLFLLMSSSFAFAQDPSFDSLKNNDYSKIVNTELSLSKNNDKTEEIIDDNDKIEEEIILSQPDVDQWMLAVQKHNRDYDLIENKLKNGQNINQSIFDGSSVISLAAWQNDEKLFNLSLQYNPDLNNSNKNGESVIHWVSASKNPNLIKSIEKNRNFLKLVNKTTKTGRTALHYNLLYSGNVEILKILLNNKIDINAQDNNGQTALMYALVSKKWDLVEYLISSGANLNLKDKSGDSFDEYVIRHCDTNGFIKLYKFTNDNTKEYIKKKDFIKDFKLI